MCTSVVSEWSDMCTGVVSEWSDICVLVLCPSGVTYVYWCCV